MSFEPKKFKEIVDEMRGRTGPLTDFEIGSVTRTLAEAVAYEVALLYEQLQLVYLSAYVDTAEGQALDNVVAILGIQRGLPDFAEGVVSFQRDIGNEPIDIPLGTLVSTEDTPETPKKVYQTIEPKTLLADHTSVDVKVQAVERGEEEVAAAETILIMPRPLPGIKAVVNRQATRFTGKRRETDDELRRRAKNALISSGKATVVAIENALLSQPGVKDVRVNEKFHYARGPVLLQRADTTSRLVVPKGTPLTAASGPSLLPFATAGMVVLEIGQSQVETTVQSPLEGKAGELAETSGVTWTVGGNGPLAGLSASNPQPIRLGQFGVVDVIVDGVELANPEEEQRLRGEIERVRAAGIFVQLKATSRVDVDAVFSITINPDLKLSVEERAAFEDKVRVELEKYLNELRMGQPIRFAQLIKNVLSLDGVQDLSDFTITTYKQGNGAPVAFHFTQADKRIEIEEFERFSPRYLCVASEVKALPVHIQFKAPSGSLSPSVQTAVQSALSSYFNGLGVGEAVVRSAVAAAISGAGATIEGNSLALVAAPWCPRAPAEGDDVAVTFVERAQLASLFAYHDFLDITGALKMTLPAAITEAEKQAVRSAVMSGIDAYLNGLAAEADVVFADLVAIAAGVDRVLAVDLAWQDFRLALNGVAQPARITKEKIAIEAFEKAHLDHFLVTGDIETVSVAVSELNLNLLTPQGGPPAGQEDALKTAVRNVVNNFLAGAAPGEDIIYDNFRSAIENLIQGANYNVTAFSLSATSAGDGRTQTTNLGTAADIHIRSVEVATMTPITKEQVNVSVILLP